MNNTLIICFSHNDDNRKNLFYELGKICNSNDNLIFFHDEPSLLEWLESEDLQDHKKKFDHSRF
jgi:hypothetical protein